MAGRKQDRPLRDIDGGLRIASQTPHDDRGPSWREWVDERLDERLQLMQTDTTDGGSR